MKLNKGDHFPITMTKGGKPADITGKTFVAVIKPHGKPDTHAKQIAIIEEHEEAEKGKTGFNIDDDIEDGEYNLTIKELDKDKKITHYDQDITIK